MSWGVTSVEEKRQEFIDIFLKNEISITELCDSFSISRKTGYKWISRFEERGKDGLKDLSRAPHNQTHKIREEVVEQVIEVKQRYPTWGPKKILAFLEQKKPIEEWPATTSIERMLKKEGLVSPRKYRKRYPSRTEPLSHCQKSNDVWCIDFKGWFTTTVINLFIVIFLVLLLYLKSKLPSPV